MKDREFWALAQAASRGYRWANPRRLRRKPTWERRLAKAVASKPVPPRNGRRMPPALFQKLLEAVQGRNRDEE